MLTIENFKEAKQRLQDALIETHLIYSPWFSQECHNEVYIKPENLQRTGSFKIRGAYNKIAKLETDKKTKGLIASSAGNHAQGVAYAASQMGVKSVICMPAHTPLIKVDSTKGYGAEVVLHGEVYDDAFAKACELQKEHGYTFIHPFNDEDVIEGQGTIALEILEELPETDIILVPIGGGGLISGIACAAKQINPHIKIIGVEPTGAASATAALKAGHVVCLEKANTIADGTAVKEIGSETFAYIQKYVDDIITISDYELMEAFLMLVEKHKLVAENSGILALAATRKLNVENKKIVSVVSGGNIDVNSISSMIQKGLISRGRIFTFSLSVSNRPGELTRITDIISKVNANIISLEHNIYRNLNEFNEVDVTFTVETNGEEHIRHIFEAFEQAGLCITRMR